MHLDPSTYRRHPLHADDRDWVERNCAIDSWIEVLHAQGLDPMGMLAVTLAVDFLDDQWTFYKPALAELWALYGMDVQELTIWQPLLEHVTCHVGAGRLVCAETDAFFLPDTQGTDYRSHHTKTNIVMHAVDVERRRLGYFHNAGYFQLEGEDFAGVFQLDAAADAHVLPLYAELIRTDRKKHLTPEALRAASARLLEGYVARRPARNPVAAFAASIEADIERVVPYGLDRYHAYAFANIRQMGSAFELAAVYLRWLHAPDGGPFAEAADAFGSISSTAKTLILKGARAVHGRKAPDVRVLVERAAAEWDRAMCAMDQALAASPRPAGAAV